VANQRQSRQVSQLDVRLRNRLPIQLRSLLCSLQFNHLHSRRDCQLHSRQLIQPVDLHDSQLFNRLDDQRASLPEGQPGDQARPQADSHQESPVLNLQIVRRDNQVVNLHADLQPNLRVSQLDSHRGSRQSNQAEGLQVCYWQMKFILIPLFIAFRSTNSAAISSTDQAAVKAANWSTVSAANNSA